MDHELSASRSSTIPTYPRTAPQPAAPQARAFTELPYFSDPTPIINLFIPPNLRYPKYYSNSQRGDGSNTDRNFERESLIGENAVEERRSRRIIRAAAQWLMTAVVVGTVVSLLMLGGKAIRAYRSIEC